MVEARDHEDDALQLIDGAHGPRHRQACCDRLEGLAQPFDIRPRRARVEHDPHTEVAGLDIVELLSVENVEPAVEQAADTFATIPGRFTHDKVRM